MDWEIDDETLRAMGGERLTITLDVAELAPGTYVYLDADDEIIMRGAIIDTEDTEHRIPPANTDFGEEDFDEQDTDPGNRTIIGPLMTLRTPAPTVPTLARTATTKGSSIQPRPPVPTPDQILNEIDDDDDEVGGHTTIGSPIKPRRPAPAKGKR